MKKLLSLVFGLGLASSAAANGLFPHVVSQLDLDSYLGRWYEVASTKPIFQKDCVCVTADYFLVDEKTVEVVNSCRKFSPEAPIEETRGTAKASKNPAKFTVNFGGIDFPFTNYWVVDLADDYRYAVVSTFLRQPIWVLSRTPEIAPEDLAGIRERLKSQFYFTGNLTPTRQDGCFGVGE